jgi:hypothetical protein
VIVVDVKKTNMMNFIDSHEHRLITGHKIKNIKEAINLFSSEDYLFYCKDCHKCNIHTLKYNGYSWGKRFYKCLVCHSVTNFKEKLTKNKCLLELQINNNLVNMTLQINEVEVSISNVHSEVDEFSLDPQQKNLEGFF